MERVPKIQSYMVASNNTGNLLVRIKNRNEEIKSREGKMSIHPTAIVHKNASIGEDVEIGPYVIVEENVKIGAGTKVGSHCVLSGWTTIGTNNSIYSGAVLGSISQDLKYEGAKVFLEIGNDNIIREYVTINLATEEGGKTVIGNSNVLMAYTHIAHDCKLEDGVIIANCGTLAGHVVVESKAVIGGLSGVHQFMRIGKLSIVGGCSKVVQDVPPFSTVDGRPARVYGLNQIGLERAGLDNTTKEVLKKAFTLLFNLGLSLPTALSRIEEELPHIDEVMHLINFVKNANRGMCRSPRV